MSSNESVRFSSPLRERRASIRLVSAHAERVCMRRLAHKKLLLLMPLLLAVLGGCSLQRLAVHKLGDAIAQSGASYASDDDLELIGAAAPFSLKLMESLLAETPAHRGLLLATTQGFVQYAYAFVELKADEVEDTSLEAAYAQRARAARMYLRARDYGLRGLESAYPGVGKALRTDPAAALAKTARDDVGLLYWTAVAWAAAISLAKDDPFLIADLPVVEALVRRAVALDETYDSGALHVFMINYEMSRAGVIADAPARARRHFARAVELTRGAQAAPYVTLAEAVSIAERNRAEFESLLQGALKLDTAAAPQWRLVNIVMQRRARWLLGRTDKLFAD